MAENNENLENFGQAVGQGMANGLSQLIADAVTNTTKGQVNAGDTPTGQNANNAQQARDSNKTGEINKTAQARGQQERTVGAINKTTSELKKAAKKATADRSTIIDLIKDTLKKEATDEDSETIDQKVDQVIEILTDIYGDLDLNGDRVAKPLINSIIKHLQSIESKIERLDIDKIVDGISTSISQSITDAVRNINITPTIEPVINIESPSSGGQELPAEITVHDNDSREILSSIEDSIKELSSSKNMAETKLENILTESVNSGITLNSINERISSFVGSFSSFQKGITDAFGQLASDIRSMFNGSNNEKDKANGQVDMGFGSKRLGPAEPSAQRGLPTGDTTKPIRIEYDYAEAAKAIATAMNKAPTTMLAESASNRTTQGVQTTRLIKYLESKNKTLGALFRGITGQSVSGGLLETIVNAAAIKYLMPHKEALLHIAGLLGKFALGGTAVAGTVYNIYSANEEAKKNEAKLEFRAADAKRYGSYIGTASGMIIGGLLGGPLGIAIGSWIGSSAGNIIGGVIAKKYEGLPQNSTFKTLGEIEEGQRLQHLQSIITSSIKEIRESSRNPADVDEEIIRSAITEGNIAPILAKISAIGEQISTTDKNDPILAELQKEKEAYMLVLGKIDHLYESARNLSGDQLRAQQKYASQAKESHWYTLGIPINKDVINDSKNLFDRRIPVEKSGSENVGVGVEALKTTDNITSALKELGVDLSLIGNDLGGSADSFLMQLQERASIRTGDTNMSIETDRFFKVMQQLGLDTTSGLIKKMSQDTVLMEEIRQYVEANTGTGFTTESGLQLLNALISSKRRINERYGRHIEKPTSVVQPDTNIEVNIPEKPSVKGESSTMVETVTSPQQPERVEQSEQNAVLNTEGFASTLSALSSSTEALRRRYETSPNEADINTGFRPINVDLKEFSSAFVAADVFNKYLESINSTSHQVEDIARVALEVARDKDISISESTNPQVILDFLTSALPDIAKKIDSSITTEALKAFISAAFNKPAEPTTQPAQTPPGEPIASLPPTIGSINVDFDIEAAEAEFARLVNGVLDNKSLRAASLTSDGVNPLVEALLLSRKGGETQPTGENVDVQVNPTVEPTPAQVELNIEKPKDVTVKDTSLYDILQFQYQEYYPIFDSILKLLEELKEKGINMGEGGGSSESNGGTGGGSGSPGGTPFSNGGGNTAEGGSYNPAPVGGRLPSGSATLSSQQMQTQLAGFQTMNVGGKTILAPTGYNANSYNRVKDTNLENWMAKQLVEGGARVSSRFGTRNAGVAGASKVHGGMDFAAATGTNIKNFVGGKVIFSGQQRDKNGNLTGYGNYVRVQGDDGNIYTYGHMSARGVKVGDRVEAGSILGQVGNTGTSGGSHLHMDVTRMVNGKKVYLPTEEVGRILMNATARGEGLAPPIQPSAQSGATPTPQGGTTPPSSPTQPSVVGGRVTRGPTKQMQSLIDQHGDFIAEQAKKYNIPVNMLLGQIQQESGGNANATSRVGAVGLMQLMPGTAKDLGVTDRTDPRQSIAAGARYMGQLMKRYNGNMDNALMAYNWGMGNVDKYLKGQKTSVPKEAREYAERVRARAANYTVEGGTPTAPTQPNQPPTEGNAPTTQPVATVTPTDQTGGITPPAVVAPTEPSVNPPAETGGEGGDRVLRASTVSIQAQTASLNAKSMTGEETPQREGEEGTNLENPPAPAAEPQTTPGANVETPPVIPPIEPSVAPINPSENPPVVPTEQPIVPATPATETGISTATAKENPDSLAGVLEEARNWKIPEPDMSTTVASLLSDVNDSIIAKNPIANPELFTKYSDEDRILDKSAVTEAVKSGELSGAEFNSLVRQEIFNEQIRKRRGIGEQPGTTEVTEETVTKEKPVEKKVEETVETVVEKPIETVTAETQTDITSKEVTPETTLVETAPPTETKVVETPESQVIQQVESPARTEIAETPETMIESQTVTAPVKETKVYLGENAEGYLPTPDTVTDEQLAAAGLGRAQYARYYGAQSEAIRNKLAEDMGLKAPIYAHRPPEETVAEIPETVVEEKQPTLTDIQVESPARTEIAETQTKEIEQNTTPPDKVETIEAPTIESQVITAPERVDSEVTATPESQSVITPEREQKVYLGEEAEGYLPPPDKISDEQLASIGRSRKQYEREYGTPTEPIRRHLANEMGLKLPIFGHRPPEETITPTEVPTEEIVTPEDISSGTAVMEERPVETPAETTTTPSWRDRLSSFGEAASNMYKAAKEKISDAYSSLTGALTKQPEQPTTTEEITAPEKPSEPTTEGIVTPEAFKVDLGPNVPEVKLPEMENVVADITPETTTIVPPTKPLSERVREGLSTGITSLKDKISSMYETGKETVANMYEAYKNGGVTEKIHPENPEAPVKPEEDIATPEVVPEKPEVVTPETTNAEIPSEQPQITPETPEAQIVTPEKVEPPKTTETQVAPVIQPATPETPAEITTTPTKEVEPNIPVKNPLFTTSGENDIITDAGLAPESTFTIEATEDNPNALGYNTPGFTPIADNGNIYRQMYNTAMAYSAASGQDNIFMGDSWLAQEARVKAGLQERNTALDNFSFKNIPEFQKGSKATFEEKYKALWGEEPTAGRLTDEELASLGLSPDTFKHGRKREEEILKERAAANTTETEVVAPTDAVSGVNPPDQTIIPPTTEEAKTEILTPAGEAMPDIGAAVAETESARVRAASTGASEGVATSVSNGLEGLKDVLAPQQGDKSGEGVGETSESGNGSTVSEEETRAVSEYVLRYIFGENANGAGVLNIF